MEQHFNFKRLILIFSLFWLENRKAFLFLLLAVGSFLIVWLGVYLAFNNPRLFSERFQIAYYFTGLFLSGCLSANFLFPDLNNKSKSINFLLLPASAAEKLLTTLFFGVGVFLVGYTLIFYMVEPVFVKLSNEIIKTDWPVINIFKINTYEDPFFEEKPSTIFFLYFTVQAFFIVGSLFFNKYSFFKTVIVLLFVWIFIVFLPHPVINSILPRGIFADGLTAFEVLDFKGNRLVKMPTWFTFSFHFFSNYIITLGLWLTTYFLLKEKQVS